MSYVSLFPFQGLFTLPSLFAFIGSAIFSYFHFFSNHQRYKELRQRFRGSRIYPIFGSIGEYFGVSNKDSFQFAQRLMEKYGDRIIFAIGTRYYVGLGAPRDVKKVLSSFKHADKSENYSLFKGWWGDSILSCSKMIWRPRRKLLTPAFHSGELGDYLPVFNEESQELVEILQEQTNLNIDISPYIYRCALAVICETGMGVKVCAQKQKDVPYLHAVHRLCESLVYRVMRPWLHIDILWKLSSAGRSEAKALRVVHEFTESVIRARRLERQNTGALTSKERNRKTFLDILLDLQEQHEKFLTDKQIRDEVDTFLFGGHHTITSSVCWTIYLLGLHQEHQAKVQAELDQIFNEQKKRPITSEDLMRMQYLELCIMESMRLFSPVAAVGRKTSTEIQLDDGVIIPENTNVVIPTFFIQRNPEFFPNPGKFDPSRFSSDFAATRHPYAYMPFSAGPRNCIGKMFAMMEMKVLVANLLRNFSISSVSKLEDVEILVDVVTRPRNGLLVRLSPR